MRLVNLVRRAARKSPAFVARRAALEVRKLVSVRRLRRRLAGLTAADVAASAGCASLDELFQRAWARGILLPSDGCRGLAQLHAGELASDVDRIRARAARALAREVDLLGSGPVRLGDPIDWHTDFKSGRRWPAAPSGGIDFAELDRPSDVKVPWELSRCQHFAALAQSWVASRDAAAADELIRQATSWIDANPEGVGVNWACTMEVGLRAVNWIYALGLTADAPVSPAARERVLLSLFRHGLWIPEHLEIGEINGNHYISDLLGMVACGALFSATPDGRLWLARGRTLLEQEIRLQVAEDGVDCEASVPYHRLVLEIFLTAALLLERAGQPVSPGYRARLEKMFGFVEAYLTPEGLSPVVGDADDGRVLVLGDRDIRDHRYLLGIGAALFGRREWLERAGDASRDAVWLLGPEAMAAAGPAGLKPRATEGADRHTSVAFPHSGFYILRSPRQYLFVDAGPVGFKGLGGHGHNDCLSFEWHADGRPLLTDSGLFVYTASPEWRNRFRSTAFHNTIRVDGEEINRLLPDGSLWGLRNDAHPIDVRFVPGGAADVLDAAHTGYRRLADPVTVKRRFELDRTGVALTIHDRLEGRAEHTIEVFFHAAPGVAVSTVRGSDPAAGATLAIEADTAVEWREIEGWFAPSYGIKVPRTTLCATIRTRLPWEATWRMTVR
jgi:hypothetical protein